MQTRHQRGFTLTESLVTLAVVGSLTTVGITTIGDIVQGIRLQNVSGDVFEQLLLARSEAIKRNGRVALCISADGEHCTSAGGWQQGWILFHDANNNGQRDTREPVLERLQPLPPDFRLSANGPLGRYVSYDAMGGTRMTSGAFQAGTFTVCRSSASAVEGRQIVINAMGRPRVQKVQLDRCP